jgi:DNA-nicking Smr family endonuclease
MTSKSGGGKSRTPRTSHLDKEDADLWSHTARSVEPLRRAKSRITAAVPETPSASSTQLGRSASASSLGSARRAHDNRAAAPVPATTPSHKKAPPLGGIDRRRVRKIATGQHEIEARLDLHGLRQSDAHRRLARFLHEAQSAGFSMVLVITGKGSARKSGDNPDPYAREEPGIIRRAVPLWLDEPGLRALVVSFTSAHPRHGGSGALYIHLRKRQRC